MFDYVEKMKSVRELTIEYLDIEFRLANTSLDYKSRRELHIRQEQIIDTLRETEF